MFFCFPLNLLLRYLLAAWLAIAQNTNKQQYSTQNCICKKIVSTKQYILFPCYYIYIKINHCHKNMTMDAHTKQTYSNSLPKQYNHIDQYKLSNNILLCVLVTAL